jgi:hypothetical protein
MMLAYVNRDGDLNAEIARREVTRQARALIVEGLASEGEQARLLHALYTQGYGAVRRRLLNRREALEAFEGILDDFFAFEAAARQ